MALQIRPVKQGDSSAVATLLEELGYQSDESGAMSRIDHVSEGTGRGALVAVEAGVVLGLISWEDMFYFPNNSTICRITALVVSAKARRKGLARLLVNAVVEEATSRDCSRIEVTTSLARGDAHRFYEAAGFERRSYLYVRPAIPQPGDPGRRRLESDSKQ